MDVERSHQPAADKVNQLKLKNSEEPTLSSDGIQISTIPDQIFSQMTTTAVWHLRTNKAKAVGILDNLYSNQNGKKIKFKAFGC